MHTRSYFPFLLCNMHTFLYPQELDHSVIYVLMDDRRGRRRGADSIPPLAITNRKPAQPPPHPPTHQAIYPSRVRVQCFSAMIYYLDARILCIALKKYCMHCTFIFRIHGVTLVTQTIALCNINVVWIEPYCIDFNPHRHTIPCKQRTKMQVSLYQIL